MGALKSIREELADCVVRFEGVGVGDWVWCCHHDILIEQLTEPPGSRINWILQEKNFKERARRLFEFRPVHACPSDEVVTEYFKLKKEMQEIIDKGFDSFDMFTQVWGKLKILERKWSDDTRYLIPIHAQEVPGTTWNGEEIIFGEEE